MINDVINDPVLQVFCREPLKSPLEGLGVLNILLIYISKQNFQSIFLEVREGDPQCQGQLGTQRLLSGTLNVLQGPPSRTGGIETLLMNIST